MFFVRASPLSFLLDFFVWFLLSATILRLLHIDFVSRVGRMGSVRFVHLPSVFSVVLSRSFVSHCEVFFS